MRRVVVFVITLALMGVASIVLDGLRDDVQVSDVGIVLGSKVMPNGRPSERLQARLDKAADLYRQGMFKQVIVSGATGKEGHSEAKVMSEYLVSQQNVPRAAIVLDEHGNTTQDTAQNCAAVMRAQGFRSALVVTQYFHVTRSRYAMHRAGITTVHTAHPRYFEVRDIYSIAREAVALPVYWLTFHSA